MASTPAPSAESADSQARPDVIQLVLRDQQRMIKDLQILSRSENDDNRRTFLAAINSLANSANRKENQIARKKEEDKYLSDPIVLKTIQGGEDDGHKFFAWELRRNYQQPNVDPAVYWEAAKYVMDVVPNYKEALYLQHLVPLSISSRAKTWAGKPTATFNIRYWMHSQTTTSSSKRKSEVCFSSTSEDGENLVTVGEK